LKYDIHLPLNNHGMMLELSNKLAFLLSPPLITQTETSVLLLHILQCLLNCRVYGALCKGNRFLYHLKNVSPAVTMPVGQVTSKFRSVAYYRSTSVSNSVYCNAGLRVGSTLLSAVNKVR
jgi:hypothetical protein